jgi:hypothetical protein
MIRDTRLGGGYTNDDHVRNIDKDRDWKEFGEREKYERIKRHMAGIEAGAWPSFRASYERTLTQQGLLSIALATEERLGGIKERMEKDLERCEKRLGSFFSLTGSEGNVRESAGKLNREYRKVREEQELIGEAENADRDPPVKAIRINKLIRLAEHERKYRPEEYGKIGERAGEMLGGSKEFENYRIFKAAYEDAREGHGAEAGAVRSKREERGISL